MRDDGDKTSFCNQVKRVGNVFATGLKIKFGQKIARVIQRYHPPLVKQTAQIRRMGKQLRTREEPYRYLALTQQRAKEREKLGVKPPTVVRTRPPQIAVRRGDDRVDPVAEGVRCHLTGNGSVARSVIHHWNDVAVQIYHKNLLSGNVRRFRLQSAAERESTAFGRLECSVFASRYDILNTLSYNFK